MRSATFLSSALALAGMAVAQRTTGKLGDAAPVLDNPIGARYTATLPNSNKTTVRGTITATTGADGKGVDFAVNFDGFPEVGGPFAYHLHDSPVPADGNCTKTLAHLDPYQRGQTIPCDKASPETCEVGDLSGKHGAITGLSHVAEFNDVYASLKPGIGAFFGNRSVVIHFANSTRITCANFTLVTEGGGNPPTYGGSSSSSSATGYATPTGYSNATATTLAPTSSPSGYSNQTATTGSPSPTTSGPIQQTVNAAMNLMAPLPAVIAVAMAAVL